MPQATVTNIKDRQPSQQPQGSGEAEPTSRVPAARLAEAFRDMESDLCDLLYMAGLSADYITDAIGDEDHSAVTGSPQMYWLPTEQVNRIIFSVNHLQQMIQRVVDDYYGEFEQ